MSVLLFSVGCTSDGPVAPVEPGVELRQLGVDHVAVAESPLHLSISGRDGSGKLIAMLQLDHGKFTMTDDDRGEVIGRRMKVNVLDISLEHESEGFHNLNLPYPGDYEVGAFLADPTVAPVLRRWGIELDASTRNTQPTERGFGGEGTCITHTYYSSNYSGTSCAESTFNANNCGSGDKLMYNKGGLVFASEVGEFRCCPNTKRFAVRACLTGDQGNQTTCGTVGPLRCAVCWFKNLNPSSPDCDLTDLGTDCQADTCQPPQPPQCSDDCRDEPDETPCGTDCMGTCLSGTCA